MNLRYFIINLLKKRAIIKSGEGWTMTSTKRNSIIEGEITYIQDDGNTTLAPTYTGHVQFLFPKMLSDGYMPLSIGDMLQQQLYASRLKDQKIKEQWFGGKIFLSSDFVIDDLQFSHIEFVQYHGKAYHYNGTCKIVLNPLSFLGSINPEIGEDRNLTLTHEEYFLVESESYLRSQIKSNSSFPEQTSRAYTKEELEEEEKRIGLLPILARDPQIVPAQYALDKNLLVNYITEVRGGHIPGYELIEERSRGREQRSLKFLTMSNWNVIQGRDNPIGMAVGKKIREIPSKRDPLENILNQIRPHINTQDRNGQSHMNQVRKILRKELYSK